MARRDVAKAERKFAGITLRGNFKSTDQIIYVGVQSTTRRIGVSLHKVQTRIQ